MLCGKETHDRVEASEGGADGETAETGLGDGAVDDTLLAEAVEETFGDFVAVWEGTLAILLVICSITLARRYMVYFGTWVQLYRDVEVPPKIFGIQFKEAHSRSVILCNFLS